MFWALQVSDPKCGDLVNTPVVDCEICERVMPKHPLFTVCEACIQAIENGQAHEIDPELH